MLLVDSWDWIAADHEFKALQKNRIYVSSGSSSKFRIFPPISTMCKPLNANFLFIGGCAGMTPLRAMVHERINRGTTPMVRQFYGVSLSTSPIPRLRMLEHVWTTHIKYYRYWTEIALPGCWVARKCSALRFWRTDRKWWLQRQCIGYKQVKISLMITLVFRMPQPILTRHRLFFAPIDNATRSVQICTTLYTMISAIHNWSDWSELVSIAFSRRPFCSCKRHLITGRVVRGLRITDETVYVH